MNQKEQTKTFMMFLNKKTLNLHGLNKNDSALEGLRLVQSNYQVFISVLTKPCCTIKGNVIISVVISHSKLF